MDDWQLLREYATRNSEEAFRALVDRYAGLVYHAALRQAGNPHTAEEVTQAVFIALAQKADRLPRGAILSGWLFRATRFAFSNLAREQIRRQRREQEAVMMETILRPDDTASVWEQIVPHLNDALDKLPRKDREAVLVRFFQDKSHRELARTLGVSEDAAKVRVSRALEKLRLIFARQGFAVPSAVLLATISAHGAQAAPAGLTASVASVAVAKGTAGTTSTLTIAKGVLKIMACTKVKTAIVVGVAVIVAAGTPLAVHVVHHRRAEASIYSSKTELTDEDNAKYLKQTGATPAQVAQAIFDLCAQEKWAEAGKYWQTGPRNKNAVAAIPDSIKRHYGGLQIVTLGKPFKARLSIAALLELQPELRREFKNTSGDFPAAGVFVPYEIRLKDGSVKKWQLSIRCDNPEQRWYYDGGM